MTSRHDALFPHLRHCQADDPNRKLSPWQKNLLIKRERQDFLWVLQQFREQYSREPSYEERLYFRRCARLSTRLTPTHFLPASSTPAAV